MLLDGHVLLRKKYGMLDRRASYLHPEGAFRVKQGNRGHAHEVPDGNRHHHRLRRGQQRPR